MKDYKGKFSVSSSFKVKEIGYNDNREINQLVIIDNKGRERFRLGKSINTTIPTTTANTQSNHSAATTEDSMKCTGCGVDINQAVSAYSIKNFGKELCRDCQSKERK
ncbi:MAG: hypothetical protein TIS_01272 [Tissierella sp.]